MMLIWQILVGNFACVALLISAWMHVSYRLYRLTPREEQMCLGFVLGLGAMISMTLSVQLEPGIYFDLRVALVQISAVFGGPLSLLITVFMASLFRLMLGGAIGVAMTGMAIGGLLGLVAWRLTGRGKALKPAHVPVFAVYVGALSILVLALLPRESFLHAMASVGVPIALLNIIVAGLAAFVIAYFRRFMLERDILRASLAQAPDFFYIKNLDLKFVAVNRNVANHHGRDRASEMTGLSDADLETPDRARELMTAERRILETGEPIIDFEEYVLLNDRDPRWYSTSKVPLRNRHGDLIGLGGVTQDITDRKRLEQELLNSRDIVTQATSQMSDGLALFDAKGVLLFCNKQYRDLFPRSATARVEGAQFRDIIKTVVRSGEREGYPVDMSEDEIDAIALRLHQEKEETFRLFNGRWINLRTRVGQNGSALIAASDITEAKESELLLRQLAEQMKGLAETDALTGVANRRSLDDRLAGELANAAGMRKPLSLLLIDVDRFKLYNDSYGHLAGDACLKQVGQCLKDVAKRATDLAARYGGEEFALILPNTDGAGALAIAEALRQRVRDLNVPHSSSEFGRVTVSIGVAVAEGRGPVMPAALIASADAALYASKEDGRDRATLAFEAVRATRQKRAS